MGAHIPRCCCCLLQTSVQASVLGTAAYLAPELMRGSKMSTASDIYSFGILSE